MSKIDSDYVVTQVGKKHLICSRRVGTAERFLVFAETPSEANADKMLTALNVLQDRTTKIEAPALRQVERLKGDIANLQRNLVEARDKANRIDRELDTYSRRERQISRDLASMTDRATKAESALSELQAKVLREREQA